jgi:hypothetical protein
MASRARLGLLGVLVAALAACGDDEPRTTPPTAPPREAAAPGSPDGGGVETPDALLASLVERMASGRALDDASWTDDVERVGLAIWPRQDADAEAARRVQAHLAHIAGDVARDLAREGDAARTRWSHDDPGSVEIHDAVLAAARGGPDVWRAFVEGKGRDLLEARIRALSAPPR